MNYDYSEERNDELINYYHQIYVVSFGDDAEQLDIYWI